MPIIDQSNRHLRIQTPFDEDCILLSLKGNESFCKGFCYQCELLTSNLNLQPDQVLGQSIRIQLYKQLDINAKPCRYLCGIVTCLSSHEIVSYMENTNILQMRRYILQLEPNFALLKQTTHCRVFQQQGQTLTQIIKKLLSPYKIDINIERLNQDPTLTLSIQYYESDYDFICRLLAHAGVYFYFQHTQTGTQLILSDQCSGYINSTRQASLSHQMDGGTIHSFSIQSRLLTLNFSTKTTLLNEPDKQLIAQIQANQPFEKTTYQDLLHYFVRTNTFDNNETGKQYLKAMTAKQEMSTQKMYVEAKDILTLGQIYQLQGTYFANQGITSYVPTHLQLHVIDKKGLINETPETLCFYCQSKVEAITSTLIACTSQIKTDPAPGPQLAYVVNPNGTYDQDQILNYDETGRVTVKFCWEEYPAQQIQANQYDTCLVNTLQTNSGGLYRVGTMVVVGFLNDNIDQPIILGVANHANNLILGEYTDENAEQTILQRYPGSDQAQYNQILLDDKDGSQLVSIQAVGDLNTTSQMEKHNSQQYSQQVAKDFQLQADSEKYQSNGLTRQVDGNYQLTANKIILKGTLTLDGDLQVNGSIEVN